jgi:hypothetical protein
MATLETIRPYVEQLLDDSAVHDHLSRSATSGGAGAARTACWS